MKIQKKEKTWIDESIEKMGECPTPELDPECFGGENPDEVEKQREENLKAMNKRLEDSVKNGEKVKGEDFEEKGESLEESLDVVDRKELASLLESLSQKGISKKDVSIKRSVKEGFRYQVTYKNVLDEQKEAITEEIVEEQPINEEVVNESSECETPLSYLFEFYATSFAKVLCAKYSEVAEKLIDIAKHEEPMCRFFENEMKESLNESIDMEALEAYAHMSEGDNITVTADLLNVLEQALEMAKKYGVKEESLKEEVQKPDREMIAGMLRDGALDDIEHVKSLNDKEFEELVDYWVDNYNTEEDHAPVESLEESKFAYTTDPHGVEGEVEAKDEEEAVKEVETKVAEKGHVVSDEIIDVEKIEEDKEANVVNFLNLEVGVLLDKDDEEFEFYSVAYDHEHGYYDESYMNALEENFEELKSKGLAYVEDGVPNTYAIITKIGVDGTKEDDYIQNAIEEIEEQSFIDDSVDFFNGDQYDASNVIWSAYKDENGDIHENFVGEVKEIKKDVKESLKENYGDKYKVKVTDIVWHEPQDSDVEYELGIDEEDPDYAEKIAQGKKAHLEALPKELELEIEDVNDEVESDKDLYYMIEDEIAGKYENPKDFKFEVISRPEVVIPDGFKKFDGYATEVGNVGRELITKDGEHIWVTDYTEDDGGFWASRSKSDIEKGLGHYWPADRIKFVSIDESLKESKEEDILKENEVKEELDAQNDAQELTEEVEETKEETQELVEEVVEQPTEETKEVVNEEKIDEMAKLPYHVLAWKLNEIIASMNNEEAYYDSGWLYIWPDGESKEDCEWDFNTKDAYEELRQLFEKVYKEYHDDGLYTNNPDILEYAHKVDAKLGLEPIQNFGKVKDNSVYKDNDPYDESLIDDEMLDIEDAIDIEDVDDDFGVTLEPSEDVKDEVQDMSFEDKMDFLSADEQEAIDGYDEVIDTVEDEHVKDQLEHIRDEEVAHKEFLDAVKEDPEVSYEEFEHSEEEELVDPEDVDDEMFVKGEEEEKVEESKVVTLPENISELKEEVKEQVFEEVNKELGINEEVKNEVDLTAKGDEDDDFGVINESCSDKELVDLLVAHGTCDSEEEAEQRVAKMTNETKAEMCKVLKAKSQDNLIND